MCKCMCVPHLPLTHYRIQSRSEVYDSGQANIRNWIGRNIGGGAFWEGLGALYTRIFESSNYGSSVSACSMPFWPPSTLNECQTSWHTGSLLSFPVTILSSMGGLRFVLPASSCNHKEPTPDTALYNKAFTGS